MKLLKSSWMTAIGAAVALAPFQAMAVDNPFKTANNLAANVGQSAGLGNAPTPLTTIIGSIINVLLGFLGVVFLIILIYAGFLWMTAAGDKGKVEKAQDMIRQSIIGLVVIIAAFSISSFVLNSLVNVSGTG